MRILYNETMDTVQSVKDFRKESSPIESELYIILKSGTITCSNSNSFKTECDRFNLLTEYEKMALLHFACMLLNKGNRQYIDLLNKSISFNLKEKYNGNCKCDN